MADIDLWLNTIENAFDFFECEDQNIENLKPKNPIQVPRVDLDFLSADEFLAKYSMTSTPIILGNADVHLPMHLTSEYWCLNHGDRVVPLDVNMPTQKNVPLRDYLAFSDKELNKRYCRSLHTCEWFPKENKFLRFPSIFGQNLLHEQGRGYPKGWSSWFELFISSQECEGFPFLHRDMCSTHAFSMQIEGIKRFVLFPPDDAPYLYVYGATGSRSGLSNGEVLSGRVDLSRWPLYANARRHVADVRPGDLFFCPAGWWHTTRALGPGPCVTLGGNFVDAANREAFQSDWGDYAAALRLVQVGAATIEHPGVVPRRPLPPCQGAEADAASPQELKAA